MAFSNEYQKNLLGIETLSSGAYETPGVYAKIKDKFSKFKEKVSGLMASPYPNLMDTINFQYQQGRRLSREERPNLLNEIDSRFRGLEEKVS